MLNSQGITVRNRVSNSQGISGPIDFQGQGHNQQLLSVFLSNLAHVSRGENSIDFSRLEVRGQSH